MAFATYATSGAIAASFGALSSGAADLLAARGMALTEAIRLLFLGYAALGLVAGLFYLQLPHTPMTAQKKAAGALGQSRNRVYGLAALFALDSFASGFAVQSLITVWLVTTHGLSATAAGTFFFWSSILAAATLPLAGWLATRFGLINTMVWTHLPSNVLLIAAAMVPDLTWALGLLLARSVCMTMDTPARASYVMAIVTPEERPAAGSVTNAPRNLAAGISPAIAGALFMAYGGAVPLIVCGVLKISYDILLLAQFRNVRPPEEERAT
jgi:predicted MFS family arabinose efflux permease